MKKKFGLLINLLLWSSPLFGFLFYLEPTRTVDLKTIILYGFITAPIFIGVIGNMFLSTVKLTLKNFKGFLTQKWFTIMIANNSFLSLLMYISVDNVKISNFVSGYFLTTHLFNLVCTWLAGKWITENIKKVV